MVAIFQFVLVCSDDNLSVCYLKDFQNFPEENSFSSDSSLASPMKKVEFNLDLDLLGSDSELNNTTEAEATNTEQNENNNNVSNAGQCNQKICMYILASYEYAIFILHFMYCRARNRSRDLH